KVCGREIAADEPHPAVSRSRGFDLPEPKLEVMEHLAGGSGATSKATLPPDPEPGGSGCFRTDHGARVYARFLPIFRSPA
ncbi:MAG: hypothetical protein ACUVWZ_06515, partial [Anaerolineae bacterium]